MAEVMMGLGAEMLALTVSMARRKEAEVEEALLESLSRFRRHCAPLALLLID